VLKVGLSALALAGVCGTIAALLTSRLYWGYWLRLPPADWEVASLASVERFSNFSYDGRDSGRDALMVAARTPWRGSGNPPVHNLPAALLARGLSPSSGDPVPPDLLLEAGEALDRAGVLAAGAPAYRHAKLLNGMIATGRDRAGASLVIAALFSGEVSNDHYAYYEAVFSPGSRRLELLGVRRYWYDVAGLEGGANLLAGFFAFAISLVAMAGWGVWTLRRGVRFPATMLK
jgi:hypothetical protein